MQIIKNDEIVSVIKEFIEEKKNVLGITQKIIGEDIFEIISKQDVVLLYYDIEDTIEGCHIHKPLKNGEVKQFIFINSQISLQEQVWTAGHELGHVWQIDQIIKDRVPNCEFDCEQLIGRFVAELLIPEDELKKHLQRKVKELKINTSSVSVTEMIKLIVYAINTFCTPYKSIVKRLIELEILKDNEYEFLLRFENSDYLNNVIKENQYSRINRKNKKKLIDNLVNDLDFLEDKKLMNAKKINRIREIFDLKRQDEALGDKLTLNGID